MAKKKLTKKQYKDKEKKNEAKKKQTELALPKIPKLSQSLVKSLYNYKIGEECGLKIEASYINGINFPATEVQELGNYFEYICTNQLPRDGHTPVAKLLKTGKPTTSYLRMDKQKENYLNIMKSYNLKVEKTGFVFTNPKYSGIADIIALDKNIKSKDKNKQRVIIDIKTSGLINDKWSPYGWANESIEEKWHYQNLENIKKYLDQIIKTGWEAKPELMRCSKCPMNDTCLYQLEVPKIQKVYV